MLLFLCLTFVIVCVANESDLSVEEMDPVLYYLLNGEYENPAHIASLENQDQDLNGGLWKCGKCNHIDELKLIYSESYTDDDIDDSTIQEIEVTHPDIKCVIVRSSSANIVRSVKGNCEGFSVMLTVATSEHFTLDIYGTNDNENVLQLEK